MEYDDLKRLLIAAYASGTLHERAELDVLLDELRRIWDDSNLEAIASKTHRRTHSNGV